MEIERKYLVNKLPIDLLLVNAQKIEQFYLSYEPEVRVRKSNDKYTVTLKTGKGLVRDEVEFPINENKYEPLKKMMISKIIKKIRYTSPIELENFKDYIFEIDVYDNIKDLIVVEVEFKTVKDADEFNKVKPKWLGKEVTKFKKYKNQTLAKK